MAKKIRKAMAMFLALSLCVSTISMQALAAEEAVPEKKNNTETVGDADGTEVITNSDGTQTKVTTTTTVGTDPVTNETTVTVNIEKETAGINNDGQSVAGSESYERSTVTDADEILVSENVSEDGHTTVATDDAVRNDYYEGGSETITQQVTPELGVDIPLTDTDDPDTKEVENQNHATGTPAGTVIDQTGDLPASEEDGNYDYTTSTVIKPGSVTVTTSQISFTDNSGSSESGVNQELDYVVSETTPTEENDLATDNNPNYLPDYPDTENGEKADVAEGYEYKYLGFGNHSDYFATVLYTTPSSDYPDEQPVYTDKNGVSYYRRREGKKYGTYQIEGFYVDGEQVEGENKKIDALWGNVTQYVLIDGETNELITTYCADLETAAEFGFSYNITNVKGSGYYTEEQAEMIMTIARNGYWGVLDDDLTKEAEYGSLEAVKDMMRDARDENGTAVFTEAEINALTDGAAMTATQYAIWHYSNQMGDVSFNNVYFLNQKENNTVKFGDVGDVPQSKYDTVDVIMKLYNYLIHMEPESESKKDTANTIINADNFVESVSVNVVKKAENHKNNLDERKDNDAYETNISFKLVVEPAENNNDSVLIKIVDENGAEIAVGRIAGKAGPGETALVPDKDGNYMFTGIVLTEGNKNFNITLEGVQNLKQGVYLYTSEIQKDEDGNDVPSQNMVGVASGKHRIDVNMNISFEFNVEEEVIAVERQWRKEWSNETTVPQEYNPFNVSSDDPDPALKPVPTVSETVEILDEEVPLIEIYDEEIPLADVPKTGDASGLWLVMILLAGMGLTVVQLTERKRKNVSF